MGGYGIRPGPNRGEREREREAIGRKEAGQVPPF
jgi:hypothetical protein